MDGVDQGAQLPSGTFSLLRVNQISFGEHEPDRGTRGVGKSGETFNASSRHLRHKGLDNDQDVNVGGDGLLVGVPAGGGASEVGTTRQDGVDAAGGVNSEPVPDDRRPGLVVAVARSPQRDRAGGHGGVSEGVGGGSDDINS